MREDVVDPRGLSWPRWAPVAVAVAAGAVGIAVVGQRLPSLGPLGVEALVVFVAVAPWAVELATGRHLPLPAFV